MLRLIIFNGKKVSVTIKNVVYVRDLRRNLIRVPVLKLGVFTFLDKGYFIHIKKALLRFISTLNTPLVIVI